MRIGLWQIAYDSRQWSNYDHIPGYLVEAFERGAELVVFPESYPFWDDIQHAKTRAEAQDILCSVCPVNGAFIGGGYVKDGNQLRNMVFLVEHGEVLGSYAKQTPWDVETQGGSGYRIVPGDQTVLFSWSSGQCIPLICADVYGVDPGSARWDRMTSKARTLIGDSNAPVVVSAYAKGVRKQRWVERLQSWADACNTSVAFCNFAGRDDQGFGGGGSGVFFPGVTPNTDNRPYYSGLYVHDIGRSSR